MAACCRSICSMRGLTAGSSQSATLPDTPASQGGRCSVDSEPAAESGVQVSIAKRFLQSREAGLAGAMPGSDIVDLPRVVQARDSVGNVRVARGNEVQSAEDRMHVFVDGARRIE